MNTRNRRLGSARVSRVGDGVFVIARFACASNPRTVGSEMILRADEKLVAAGHHNQDARRVRYPTGIPHRVS